MIRCCQEIQQTIQRFGDNPLVFQEDSDYRRSIQMSCIEIGEILGLRLSDFFRYSFTECDWLKFVKMRHYLVHRVNRRGYRKLDVWRFIHQDIPDLQRILEKKLKEEGEGCLILS
ncbi:hypothetical protein RV03_GL001479 [Enterococcus gallinarum]|nr:hypothetical protein RV03_GL001479 [Enterococcus gallinarum]